MDKDIREKIDNLIEKIVDTLAENLNNSEEKIKDAMDEACEIHIKKQDQGNMELCVKGNRLALIFALAGAEKSILKQIKCTPKEFEYMKSVVATEGVDNIE